MVKLLPDGQIRHLLKPEDSLPVQQNPTGLSPKLSFGFMPRIILPFVFLLALATSASGAPTISCHCFQERSFDPAEPRQVEPYLLATTRNSFLAVAFGQSKKEIVRLRMTGTPGADLWIAYYLASKTDIPARKLMQSREKADSWSSVLAAQGIDPMQTGPYFARALTGGKKDRKLADAAADETIAAVTGTVPEELRQFRQRGADTGEIILAFSSLSTVVSQPLTFIQKFSQARLPGAG